MDDEVEALLHQADSSSSVDETQRCYQAALQLIDAQIRKLPPGSAAHKLLLQHFKSVLLKAEAVKQQEQQQQQQQQQHEPLDAACYQQCRDRATLLAQQAVAADVGGDVAGALQQYFALLEVLNQCHRHETDARVQAAIMARFQVYLERAEQLKQQQEGFAAADSNSHASL